MITTEMLRSVALFAPFEDEHFARLATRAAEVTLGPGEFIVYTGEVPAFVVILAGSFALSRRIGARDHPVGVRTAGDYFGDVPILLGVGSPV